jgi:hypothetical protein
MTGAVACLAGFEDLAVVVHGSSGCYFYPASLVGVPVHGTFLVENEIIFGTESRLQEVIRELEGRYSRIAVVNTCVPAIMGEEIGDLARDGQILIVDSPGFLGDLEAGYHRALERVAPAVDPDRAGVNIDGICRTDPFCRGNALEARRLLNLAGAAVATTFCLDRYDAAHRAAPFTVGTNPDLASGVGTACGSLLGLDSVGETFENLAASVDGVDARPSRKRSHGPMPGFRRHARSTSAGSTLPGWRSPARMRMPRSPPISSIGISAPISPASRPATVPAPARMPSHIRPTSRL